MENKYYTPKIEEFHVGFEYEFHPLWLEWEKNILDYLDTIKLSDDAPTDTAENPFAGWGTLEDRFRVKYLDKEDIESLGWEDGELHGMGNFLAKDSDGEEVQMYLHDNLSEGFWFIQIYNYAAEYIFQGKIKNKSELKRLMEMLDIQQY